MNSIGMELKGYFYKLNTVSKKSLKYGLLFAELLFLLAFAAYVAANTGGDYWPLMKDANDLATCALGSCAAVVVTSLLGDIILKYDYGV